MSLESGSGESEVEALVVKILEVERVLVESLREESLRWRVSRVWGWRVVVSLGVESLKVERRTESLGAESLERRV